MKRTIIIVGVILGVLGLGYFYSKSSTQNKSTTGSTDTNDTEGETQGTNKKIYVSEKMGLTYEGQAIYKKYKGVAATGSEIGYLIDGTLLTTANTVYKDGEYKAKPQTPPSNGDVPNNILGTFLVDNTLQVVYQKREGINLANYPNALGFLGDGKIVYSVVVNPGEESESTIYFT